MWYFPTKLKQHTLRAKMHMLSLTWDLTSFDITLKNKLNVLEV